MMKRLLFAATGLLLAAGCASNTTFVYKPPAPAAVGRKLPLKLAVLPFKDGTEDFTKRGNELFDQEHLMYNLAKAGIGSTITALTPDLWAKAFADDLAASGDFQSAPFVYGASELKGEDFVIEGTVEKAIFSGTWDKPNEFAISLRAMRRADNRPAWDKQVARTWKTPPPGILYDGCRMGPQCMVDRLHADLNKTMQGMFAEARADLAATIRPGGGGAASAPSPGEIPKGPIVGVGLEVRGAPEGLSVVRALEGAPAAKAGIREGDSIVSIDGRPTRGEELAAAVGRIRGVKGTPVTLGVLRSGWTTERVFTLVRDVLQEGAPVPPSAPESVDETIEGILKGN